jgi:transposase
LLEGCGHETIVANARKLRLIYQNPRKNDRTDAESLARVARMDPRLLGPVKHRGKDTQADLGVLRARDGAVAARTQLVNQVRGLAKSAGVRLRSCSTASFADKVPLQLTDELRPALEPLVAVIRTLTEAIEGYDRTIEEIAAARYPDAGRLRQVNGVGPVTALTYVLTIDDPTRFRRSRSVGAYLGLTARQNQSGDQDPEMRITKTGDCDLRRLLVCCAQHILGPFGADSDLRRWGLKLASRGDKVAKKRAVVAVARKLAVLLHRLWVSGEPYDPLKNASRSEARTTDIR